jgi:hypothetical protein
MASATIAEPERAPRRYPLRLVSVDLVVRFRAYATKI